MARLGQAPANCNYKGLQSPPETRDGHSSPVQAQVFHNLDCDLAVRPGYQRASQCASALGRVGTAQRRQMWLLARELCASASLYGVGGRSFAAKRTLRFAFKVLRDRAGIFEVGTGDATTERD